jgi:hypothetical protein
MREKIKYFFVFCMLIGAGAFAGSPYDTAYIKVFKQDWTIVVDAYAKGIDFSIFPLTHIDSIDLREIKYLPNVSSYYGLSESFKGWGLGISWRVPASVKSDSIYGKTRFYDYKFSLHKRRFGGTAYFRYYQGFYLNNPAFFDTTWTGGALPQRSDLGIASIGLNAYYLFNYQKFSMKSVFGQTERQRKTASSFILQTDVNTSILESDSSLIPAPEEQYYQSLKGFQDMFQYSFSVAAGYAFCLAIQEYYYVCPMLFLGPGFQHKLMNADIGKLKKNNGFLRSDFKFAAGYNGKSIYTGMLFDAESSLMPVQFAQFKSTIVMLDFFIGYRF